MNLDKSFQKNTIEEENSSIKFHIDVNSAFLSWSAIKLLSEGSEIDIRTIPAIVGGDQETRRGIVVAKSIPAKAYGIETAETVASALSKCPNLYMVPPDHTYYKEKSRLLMEHLSQICPVIEQVSIDECYMSYEPLRERFPNPVQAAYYIKDSVRDTLCFTVNIGISDRKVLAKMASDFKKPDRVHTLFASEIEAKLWPLPISELHMCGRSSAAKFQQYGILTIGDLAKTDPSLVFLWLKSHGKMLWNYANGIDKREIVMDKGPVKSVGNSTTLAQNLETAEEAYPVLKKLAESVSLRLQKKDFIAEQISVEIKYATFVRVSHQMTLSQPSSNAQILYKKAKELFQELWNGEPIRLLGVSTTKLKEASAPVQLSIEDYLMQMALQAEEEEKLQKEKLAAQEAIQKQKMDNERLHLENLEDDEKQGAKRLEEEERLRLEEKNVKKKQLEEALSKIKRKYGDDIVWKGTLI